MKVDKVSVKVVKDPNGFGKQKSIGLKLRVTFKMQRRYYSTGVRMTEEELANLDSPNVKGKLRTIKNKLGLMELDALNMAESIRPFTFKKFAIQFFTEVINDSEIAELFKKKIQRLLKNDQIGSASSYEVALSSLLKFKSAITLNDIDVDFLKNYEKWMLSSQKSKTTVGIYLRCLRAILNQAIEDKIYDKDQYPFGKRKYKIPNGGNIKKALDLHSIKQIFEYKTLSGTTMEMAKDFWIFSYLCNGINMKDIAFLKWKNVNTNSITFERQKTKNTSTGSNPLIQASRNHGIDKIINKWSTDDCSSEQYVFKILEQNNKPVDIDKKVHQFIKTVNKWMKIIGKDLNFDLNLTTYVARHSFATIIVQKGGSIEFVSQSLGHSSIVTTQKYFAGFDLNSHKELTKVLTDFD